MHIEFIGLPGAGKSTIRTGLLNQLSRSSKEKYLSVDQALLHVAKENIDGIYRYPLQILPNHFSLMLLNKINNRSIMHYNAQNEYLALYGGSLQAYLASSAYQSMSEKDRSLVIGFFLEAASIKQCLSNHLSSDHTVIFDESLLQKSFMFVNHKENLTSSTDVINYLEYIPIADIAIVIDTDIEVCLQRIRERPRGLTSRLKKLDENEISQFFAASSTHIKTVQQWLLGNTATKVIEIDNHDSPSQAIDLIFSQINKSH